MRSDSDSQPTGEDHPTTLRRYSWSNLLQAIDTSPVDPTSTRECRVSTFDKSGMELIKPLEPIVHFWLHHTVLAQKFCISRKGETEGSVWGHLQGAVQILFLSDGLEVTSISIQDYHYIYLYAYKEFLCFLCKAKFEGTLFCVEF